MGLRALAKAGAIALLGGCVLPMALVTTAGAFVDPSTMKKVVVLGKVGAAVGTKLAPLRMVTSITPMGAAINLAVFAGGYWLTETEGGQALTAKIWNELTGGPKDGVSNPGYATTVPTRAPDYCRWTVGNPVWTGATSTTSATITHSWSVENFSPTGTGHADCESATGYTPSGNWRATCKATVAAGTWAAGQVGTGNSGAAGGATPNGGTVGSPCAILPAASLPVPVALEYYVAANASNPWNSFYVVPVIKFNPNGQVTGQDGVLAATTVLTVRKDCKNISTGAVTTVSASSAPGTANVPGLVCPAGTYVIAQRIYSSNGLIDSNGSATTLIASSSIPQSFRDSYPNCLGPTSSGCHMSITVDGVECAYGVTGCANWWDIAQTAPTRVKCLWGPLTASPLPYTMEVYTDCSPLRHAYRTAGGAVADPLRNGDADPVPNTGTVTNPQPWPVSDPLPSGDPNANPSTNPSTSASAQPTTSTAPQTFPQTGTNPQTQTDPGTNTGTRPGPLTSTGTGTLNSTDPANCWATSWTWNPISWVFTPVKCALVWAFVPAPANLSATTARFKTAVNGTAIGSWSNAFSAYPAAFTSSGGASCSGPALALPAPFSVTLHPAQTCTGPSVMLSNVCKFGIGALLAVSGTWACARLILAGVGYQIGGGGAE